MKIRLIKIDFGKSLLLYFLAGYRDRTLLMKEIPTLSFNREFIQLKQNIKIFYIEY